MFLQAFPGMDSHVPRFLPCQSIPSVRNRGACGSWRPSPCLPSVAPPWASRSNKVSSSVHQKPGWDGSKFQGTASLDQGEPCSSVWLSDLVTAGQDVTTAAEAWMAFSPLPTQGRRLWSTVPFWSPLPVTFDRQTTSDFMPVLSFLYLGHSTSPASRVLAGGR